jgi:hypothetical protein
MLIDDITFIGRQRFLNQVEAQYLDPWEYRIEENGDSEGCICKHRNTVYQKNDDYVIWFNGKEYPFDINTGIAKIPIEGYVNYLGDIVRSDFV